MAIEHIAKSAAVLGRMAAKRSYDQVRTRRTDIPRRLAVQYPIYQVDIVDAETKGVLPYGRCSLTWPQSPCYSPVFWFLDIAAATLKYLKQTEAEVHFDLLEPEASRGSVEKLILAAAAKNPSQNSKRIHSSGNSRDPMLRLPPWSEIRRKLAL